MLTSLGRVLDRLFPRLALRVERVITRESIREGVLIDLLADAYLQGRDAAWVVHGEYLRAPRSLPARIARAALEAALAHATLVTRKAQLTLGARANPTVAHTQAYARIAAEQSVWRGQDDGATDLARLMQAEWKEWVRAWPREDPRDHHAVLEGVIIPTDDHFILPGRAPVYAPRDWDAIPDPGEWLQCGHALRYRQTVTRSELGKTLEGAGIIYDPRGKPVVTSSRT